MALNNYYNINDLQNLITFFLKGIAIGFTMAIPIGPIGIMCIRRTLNEGRLQGLIIGLGASAGDMLYSCVAAFGLTVISDVLITQKFWIRLIGGILLLFLGAKAFKAQPTDPKLDTYSTGKFRSFITSMLITLTNPLTIFVFIGLFATFGLAGKSNHFTSLSLVTGVLIGSILWFLILSSGVSLFRKKFDLARLRLANKIAGILIVISGIISIASLL